MNGMITTNENYNLDEVLPKIKEYKVAGVVRKVTCKEKYVLNGDGPRVALMDFGAKKNIAKSLNDRGCEVTVYPAYTKASQMSETLFILAIPFFLKHFGIKQVMLISMFAWVFRFGLFGFGDPGGGLWMLILSMIVYGMAFDFFNISGSLFVEQETNSSIRASAQGLFFMMTNGLGAIIGGYASGAVVDAFSVYADGKLVSREWTDIWLIFAAYALVIGILFALVFKYKHRRESKTN